MKGDLTSRQQGAAKLLRCHFTQLLYFYLSRKQFHPWRAIWRHAKWVLPNFFVSIPCNYFTFTFSENNFIHEEQLDVTTTGCCQIPPLPFLAITLLLSFPKTISFVKSDLTSRQLGAAKFLRCHFWQLFYFCLFRKQFRRWRATWRHDNWVLPNFYVAISGNYFTFIFSENFFIREERLDVPTTGSCQTSTLPFLAMIFSENNFIRQEQLDVTTTGSCQTSTLPFLAMIFSENIFIREEQLDVTTTGCCQTSTLPFLAITLLLSFPETSSSVKSDLTSRQLGAAKLLRCHCWLWSFPKTIPSVKRELPSRQLGGAKLLRCHFCQLLYFHLFRKQFHPWRATWRHDNRVLPNFSVAISLNYFTFISPENNFIPEERLDVTLSGCCQISSFPILAIILLLPFPKTISSMKSNLTSRQLGAAKLLRCHFWQLLYFYLFRKQFHSWRATWRHDNWVLPSFSVAISGNYFTFIFSENNFVGEEWLDVTTTGCCQTSTLPFLAITLLLSFPKTSSSVKSELTSRQLGAAKLLRCHFWLWSFPKTISSVKSNLTSRQLGAAKLLRCHFWLWSFPKTFSSVKSNLTSRQLGAARLLRCHIWQLLYFIFSGNNFIRGERLDVTTTGCCQTSTLPLLAMIFSENNSIHEERLAVTTTGWCQASTLPFLSITLLSSFPKTISSVKSDLTSRQLGAAKLLRCHF